MKAQIIPAKPLTRETVRNYVRTAQQSMLNASESAHYSEDPSFVSMCIDDAINTLRMLKLVADTQATVNRARFDRGNAVK